jgi:monoterpene epsilon-lactone hydrolase
MSARLWLYTAISRRIVKPLFRLSDDPIRDAAKLDRLGTLVGQYVPFTCRLDRRLGGRSAKWVTGRGSDSSRLILFFHGGGYFAGSADTHGPMMARLSSYAGVPVVIPNYRLSTEAPFPAAFDDAMAVWDDLMARGYEPSKIVIGGDSAGGGLALALLAALCARDERPAGIFTMSPWTDLTLSGESVDQNAAADAIIPADRMGDAARMYHAETPADDPRVSPLFADFDAPPPAFFQVGSPEVLADDTYRMAEVLRSAGGEVEVQTWHDAPHVWHLGEYWVPEARAALRDIARFVQTSFERASR